MFVGPTGSGKSYCGLRLAELIEPAFTLSHLVFSAENFLDLINDANIVPGQALIWDEAGLGMPAREWQSIFNRSIGYVLQSFRFKRIALILTVPDDGFIDSQARALFHYYFECVRINRDRNTVTAKPFIFQHSARFGKDYTPYPQVKTAQGSVKVGSIDFALPTSDLRESYERKRKGYMEAYYAELRDSLSFGSSAGNVPVWAWRAITELAIGKNQAELAGILQITREWANKLLRMAKTALKENPKG